MAATALLLAGCAGTGEPDEDDTPSATAQEPSFEGRWQADDPEGAFLEFDPVDEDGGTLTGSDGCNGVGGEFFVDGSTARIDRAPGTLKGCTGVDTWLKDVATVVLDGDTMTVQDSEGEDLGTLTRAEDADETAPVSTGSPSASIGEATDEPTDEDD
jgi:heat shock protein HslJ